MVPLDASEDCGIDASLWLDQSKSTPSYVRQAYSRSGSLQSKMSMPCVHRWCWTESINGKHMSQAVVKAEKKVKKEAFS